MDGKMRSWRVFGVVACMGVVLASAGCQDEPAAPDPRDVLAAQVVGDLQGGRLGKVVEALHFPASQSPEERSEDMANTEWTLDAILSEFGAIETVALAAERASGLQLTVASGEDAYWKTYPNA